jgi:hypothetical protein
LLGGGEDAERDWQIEPPRLLGQVGRRQVDGDALRGEFEAAVLDGGADAVLGFLDLGVGQADDGKRWAVKELL